MKAPLKKLSAGNVPCAFRENQATAGGRKVEILKATAERRYQDMWRNDEGAPAIR